MAVPVWSGVSFGPTGQKIYEIVKLLVGSDSGYYITSAFRPSDTGSHHGGLYFNGSPTAAIDVGFGYGSSGASARARKLASKLYAEYALVVELIVSKVGSPYSNGGYYVKNNKKVSAYAHTGSNTSVRHEDHIHLAMSSAQADKLLAKLKKPAAPPPPPVAVTPKTFTAVQPYHQRPVLRRGASGEPVRHLQFLLRDRLGYAIDKVSGYPFGPQTEAAVRKFQTAKKLTVDGVVGSQTWPALEEAACQAVDPENRPVLHRGDSGAWVGYLCHVLRKAKFSIDHVQGFPYGPQTEAAVRGFRAKLRARGIDFGDFDTVNKHLWAYVDDFCKTRKYPDPVQPEPEPEPEPEPGYDNKVKPIFGWDASDYDYDRGARASHVAAAASEGIRFFTHKITEKSGSGQWVHSRAGAMLKAARDAGIPFLGAYIVPRSGISVTAQVDFALAEAERQCSWWKNFPGWFWQVDLEKWSYDAVPVSIGTAMCEELERRTGRKVVLYAPRWAYGNTIPAPWNAVIWNSHYVSGSGSFKSLYPGSGHAGWATMSGKRPVILQYSSSATIGGQRSCDANAFEGTEADFAKMIAM